jgi:nitrate reductase gamma subunit
MDGSVMVMLANWAQYTVTLQPMEAAAAIAPVGLVYKLHVFLGLSLFVLFPFTRLVHIISAPVWYLGRRYQIVRQKGVHPVAQRPQVRPLAQPGRATPVPAPQPGYAMGAVKAKEL